jgi:uncharacterized membrane protein YjfL (UPF0719 family)
MHRISELFDTSSLKLIFDVYPLAFLLIGLAMMYVAKLVNDFTTPYNLAEQLTQKDNKAIAVSFAGYLLATGILVWGILRQDINPELASSGDELFKTDLLNSTLWILFGILLLQVARVANDVLLLHKFCNIKELVDDQNVGTGVVQAGSYIGTALIIQAALYGDDSGYVGDDLLLTLAYFVIGQLAFIVFGIVYEKITPYDLHDEIEKDNAAAGLGFGLSLVAIGMLLSSFILNNGSLIGLLVWFVISTILLPLCRIVTDKLILPGSNLNDEISKDRNWGAALIEGIMAISVALILGTLF